MRNRRIPLWQSLAISVTTAVVAVVFYEAVFVPEPPAPVVIVAPAAPPPPPVAPAAQPPKRSSDPRVRARFEQAVDLMRNRNTDEGCALLEAIFVESPDDVFSAKAAALYARRCE